MRMVQGRAPAQLESPFNFSDNDDDVEPGDNVFQQGLMDTGRHSAQTRLSKVTVSPKP